MLAATSRRAWPASRPCAARRALPAPRMKTDELFAAIRSNDAAAVAALLDADRALVGARQNGVTPVLFAAYTGHPELARLFIDRGAQLGPAELAALGDRKAL